MGLFVNFGTPQSSFGLNNNLATTLALGEEGGDALTTASAQDIFNRADTDTFGQKDGKLTTFELYQYGSGLHHQVQMMRWMDNWMPWMGLGNWANQLEGQLNDVNAMLRNFGTIAGADGDAVTMTVDDILKTANKDGKADDLSGRDLERPVEEPKPTEPTEPTEPAPAPPQQEYLSRLNLVLDMADVNRDGMLTKTELSLEINRLRQNVQRGSSPEALNIMKARLKAAELMEKHFDRLAVMDNGLAGGNAQTLSKFDLFSTARLDGNFTFLSEAEIPVLMQ